MKITIFANGVSNGGAEHVACNLSNFFVSQNYEVDLLTMADDKPTYFIDNRVNRISILNASERKGFIHNLSVRKQKFIEYIKQSDTDCFIAFFPIATIILSLLRKRLKVPVITSERANPYKYSWYYKILLKKFVPLADINVFQSLGQKFFYGNRLNEKNCRVIPNACEIHTEPKEWSDRKKVIVSAGRLTKTKNYSMLINAFSTLQEKGKDYKLIIYGEGPERSNLENQIRTLGLTDRVYLPGRKDNVEDYIKECKIFVLSSMSEGMPNALIEAMSLGLACIATDCPTGGCRSLITTNVNGILIPVENTDELADSMERLIDNEDLAIKLGIEATKINKEYSPVRIYAEWEDVVKYCIDKNFQNKNIC